MSNKPIILLIHGMGTHSDESIKGEFISGLKQSLSFYTGEVSFNPENLADQFDFDFFNYSDDWDNLRSQYADYLDDELKKYLFVAPSVVTNLFDTISDFSEDEFLYTHALDVLFYLVGTIRAKQQGKLHDVLISKIEQRVKSFKSKKLIVVAHSLGTAFAHDALTQLYSNNLDPAVFRLDQLWMIANVSRLTQMITNMDDPLTSIVIDHGTKEPGGVTKAYYSVYNKFDPFCWFKRYDRGIDNGAMLRTKQIRDLKVVYGEGESLRVNPHDLREYYADPAVGLRFFGSLKMIKLSQALMSEARVNYKKTTVTGKYEDVIEKAELYIKELETKLSHSSSIGEKLKVIAEVFERVASLREKVK